ncbi:hypothetical protein DRO97_03270 [Archaeoglobales archaeon]|nr:MAG: hypothetical protein DRO97_03270 [Archaeoglobales archaeon]
MIVLNFEIKFENNKWVANDGEITVVGKTLIELDENLKKILKKKYRNAKIKVNMSFDEYTISTWKYMFFTFIEPFILM